jgi:hypothetical protein
VKVPLGVQRISLYFFNKDGHTGPNRFRDYLIELYGPGKQSGCPVTRALIEYFWGGCYKEFAVAGPGMWRLRVAKNGSLNTVLPGAMVDELAPGAGPDVLAPPMRWVGGNGFAPPPLPAGTSVQRDPSVASREKAARNLWEALDAAYEAPGAYALQRLGRLEAYRAMCSVDDTAGLATADKWRWKLGLWMPAYRQEWDQAMARAWQGLIARRAQAEKLKH